MCQRSPLSSDQNQKENCLPGSQIGDFIHTASKDAVCQRAYWTKSLISLLLSVGSLIWGCFYLADGHTFAFHFHCQLDRQVYGNTLTNFDYYCANKSDNFTRTLQILFLCATILNILVDLRCDVISAWK